MIAWAIGQWEKKSSGEHTLRKEPKQIAFRGDHVVLNNIFTAARNQNRFPQRSGGVYMYVRL